jgi:hypothetical protein
MGSSLSDFKGAYRGLCFLILAKAPRLISGYVVLERYCLQILHLACSTEVARVALLESCFRGRSRKNQFRLVAQSI